MSIALFCAFVMTTVVAFICIRRGHVWASFASFLRGFPVLALALLAFTVAPLHAQDKVRAAVHKVSPVYPPIAQQMGISGSVVVNATVDPSGKVVKAESSSTNKVFVSAAIEAVKQWKFAPADSTDTFPITVDFHRW
jgi:TonB family protein